MSQQMYYGIKCTDADSQNMLDNIPITHYLELTMLDFHPLDLWFCLQRQKWPHFGSIQSKREKRKRRTRENRMQLLEPNIKNIITQ